MTTKTKKNTKNTKNTKTKVPKNFEKKINELKKIQAELDECMYSNCKSISKKEITDMMDKCKKKTEHIKSIIERNSKKKSCMVNFFMKKGDKLKKLYNCVEDKCSDKSKESMLKTNELSIMINPDIRKINGLYKKIDKLHIQDDKCYDKKCKHIFPDSLKISNDCYEKYEKLSEKKRHIKMNECLKSFNFDEKMEKLNKCGEEKCKSISNKIDFKLDIIHNEIKKITNKTIELSAKYAKIYNIQERPL